jgi:inosine-uridine nucleoside N-ribohydrolase
MTVLAIGPLTTIATLLDRRPGLASRIERLVIMGGNIGVSGNVTPAAEFNFWFDPEAARAVFRSPVRKILFPLDICNQAVVARKQFEEVASARTPVARLYRESFGNGYPGFLKNPAAKGYLWDELAAAYLIDPGVVERVSTRYLDVVTEFGPRYGAVVAGDHPVDVAEGAVAGRAWNLVRSLLTR